MTFPDYEAAEQRLHDVRMHEGDTKSCLCGSYAMAAVDAALGDRVLYSTNEPDAEEIHDLIAIRMLHPEWPKDALTEEDDE